MKKHEHECSPSNIELKKVVIIDGKPSRICAGCGTIMLYKTMKGYESSLRIGTKCLTCGSAKRSLLAVPLDLTRECPSCKTKIIYNGARCWRQAERAGRMCRDCANEKTRQTTRDPNWREAHACSLKDIWRDTDSVFNDPSYRATLAKKQQERTDDRSIGALKAANTRKESGQQDRITQLSHTPEANNKRRLTHLELRKTHPELWQTQKAKAGWNISGEKGKTYIDRAIRVAQSGNKRSIFERSFEMSLNILGFVPTQQINRWWVDYINHDTKVVVECYGDWYHCHPKYDKKIEEKYNGIQPECELSPVEKRAKDEARVHDIESNGYTVIVIWQHDAKHWLSWINSSLPISTKVF